MMLTLLIKRSSLSPMVADTALMCSGLVTSSSSLYLAQLKN